MLPHFSFASTLIDNTHIATSSNISVENSWYGGAEVSSTFLSSSISSGSVVYYAYLNGSSSNAWSYGLRLAFWDNTGIKQFAYGSLDTTSTFGGLITGSTTVSNLIPSGYYVGLDSNHGSTSPVDYVLGNNIGSGGCGSNCTNNWEPWFYLGTTPYNPISPSSSISFVFPTNGTSTGIFNPWLLSASNLNASDTYITKVMWQACPVGQVQNSANCTQTIFNHSEPQTGADIALHGITVQRVEWPFDFGSNQTVYASAELQDNGFVAVDSINFTLLSIPNSSPSSTLSTGGIYIIASSTGNGTYVTTSTSGFTAINALGTSTVSAFCPPPGDPTGYIGYGLCQAVNFAFNPNIFPQSVSYFGNQISAIEAVPPFSGFFAFFNDASSSLNTGYQNSSSTSVSIGILGFNSNGSMPQVNLVTLNSTTFNNGMGGSTHASSTAEATGFLETYIGAFLWIAAGIRILHLFAVS